MSCPSLSLFSINTHTASLIQVIIPLEDIGLGKILHRKFDIQSCEDCDDATGKLELIVMWEPRGETQAARAQKEKQEAEAKKRKKVFKNVFTYRGFACIVNLHNFAQLF
jgi:hypothetical protein